MPNFVNRRDLFKSALITGAAATLGPAAAEAQATMPGQTADSRMHPGEPPPDLSSPGWKPVFLDAHQNDTLIALADRILPATATPGATAAQVNRFIDLLLAAESRERQQSFVNSLSWIDGESQRRYRAPFASAPPEDQTELLEFLAYPMGASGWTGQAIAEPGGHEHFERLKGWISEAFYSSEIGMKSLGWDGNMMHGVFLGCERGAAHAKDS